MHFSANDGTFCTYLRSTVRNAVLVFAAVFLAIATASCSATAEANAATVRRELPPKPEKYDDFLKRVLEKLGYKTEDVPQTTWLTPKLSMSQATRMITDKDLRILIDDFLVDHPEIKWLKEKDNSKVHSVYQWGFDDHSAGRLRYSFVFCVDKEGFIIATGYKEVD